MTDNLLTPDQGKIDEARHFITGLSSVILSTVTDSGIPHTSYAPTISDQGNFYVFVSGLAQHAKTLSNGHASLFFVEDESQAKTIFARTRLTLECTTHIVDTNSEKYNCILDQLEARHGSTIKLLRTLPDFVLYEARPNNALFVTGFGAAYDLSSKIDRII